LVYKYNSLVSENDDLIQKYNSLIDENNKNREYTEQLLTEMLWSNKTDT